MFTFKVNLSLLVQRKNFASQVLYSGAASASVAQVARVARVTALDVRLVVGAKIRDVEASRTAVRLNTKSASFSV